MNSEDATNAGLFESESINSSKNRKVYSRDDLLRYCKYDTKVPEYLKDFPYVHTFDSSDNWLSKPLPKFEEMADGKGKAIYHNNKSKVRQRTLSNQSGTEYLNEQHENYNKSRNFAHNKYNRHPSNPNELHSNDNVKSIDLPTKFVNQNDFEEPWHKVEGRTNRQSNSSKPYSQNMQLSENHWKKWNPDSSQINDKNRTQNSVSSSIPYRGHQQGNWSRRNEYDSRPRVAKLQYGRHSVSKSGDQTEDIWQDDWESELKAEMISTRSESLSLDTIMMSQPLNNTPPASVQSPVDPPLCSPSFETPEGVESPFDMWRYLDLSSRVQGPFSSDQMANWLATGYFDVCTFISRVCDEKFLLLAEYRALYGRIPFTEGPTIKPILKDTPIDIDIKQLLIGVDINLAPKVMQLTCSSPAVQQFVLLEMRKNEEMRVEMEKEREKHYQEKLEMEAKIQYLEQQMLSNIDKQMSAMESESIISTDHNPLEEHPIQMSDFPVNEQSLPTPIGIDSYVNEVDYCNDVPGAELVPEFDPVQQEQQQPQQQEQQQQQPQQHDNQIDNSNHWISSKQIKAAKKNKKAKQKAEQRNSKEEIKIPVPIPEAKRPEQPTDTRLAFVSRETFATASALKLTTPELQGKPIKIEFDFKKSEPKSTALPTISPSLLEIQSEELEKQKLLKESQKIQDDTESIISTTVSSVSKNDERKVNSSTTWKSMATTPSDATASITVVKSLLEIQEEESLKEKLVKELQEATRTLDNNNVNKVTSFKDSLLKSAKPQKAPMIPTGKSIWDMPLMEIPAVHKETSNSTPAPTGTVAKRDMETPVPKSNQSNKPLAVKKASHQEPDKLSSWCAKRLQVFADRFDLTTVIEMLKEVNDEEVLDLALQSLDDSTYTRKFIEEFIKKRQEFSEKLTTDSWQTVKKPIVTAPGSISAANSNNNNTNSSNNRKGTKSKPKKKIIPIDTKFK